MTNTTKVFLDYDQEALNRAYNQAAYAPNAPKVQARMAARSEEARRHLGEPLRLAYGPSSHEALDLYRTDEVEAPVVVYVHGGAWRGNSARVSAGPAEVFVSAGAHYIALDFILVHEADGSLFPMVEQVRRAIAWLHENATSFGGDPARICLAGHSSGAHLGACALITDWEKEYGLPPDIIKSAILSSGMYELYPVSLSARSNYVSFTPAMLEALSPMRHLERLNTPLTVAFGSLETPEFQRQAREFAAALLKAGKPVELIEADAHNHFEMLETLSNPFGVLGRAALRRFGLSRATSYEPRASSSEP
jgi:arylformamidase